MNTLRIVKLNAVDILLDPKHAAGVIAKACARDGIVMRPTGCCDIGDGIVYIPLAESPLSGRVSYYFSMFPDSSSETVVSELNLRYMNNMSLIGSFRFEDTLWGFWARES